MKFNIELRSIIIVIILSALITSCSSNDKNEPKLSLHKQKMISLFPDDTQIIIYANVKKLKSKGTDHSYFNNSIPNLDSSSWFRSFSNSTRINFKDGISEMYIANTWDKGSYFVLVLDKNFEKVEKHFNNKKIFGKDDKGYFIKNDPKARFLRYNDSTLIVVNDTSGNIKEGQVNQKFMEAGNYIKDNNDFWLISGNVANITSMFEIFFGGGRKLPVSILNRYIKSVSISAEVDDGYLLKSTWSCKNSNSAFMISNSAKSAVSMGVYTKNNPELDKLFDKMDIDQEDKNINFEIKLDKQDLLYLKKLNQNKK